MLVFGWCRVLGGGLIVMGVVAVDDAERSSPLPYPFPGDDGTSSASSSLIAFQLLPFDTQRRRGSFGRLSSIQTVLRALTKRYADVVKSEKITVTRLNLVSGLCGVLEPETYEHSKVARMIDQVRQRWETFLERRRQAVQDSNRRAVRRWNWRIWRVGC